MAKWWLRCCMNWRRRNNSPSSANHCSSSARHCLVTLLYVTMITDPELVKVTSLWGPLYQLRVITHLPAVICRPEKCNQWIIWLMSWPEYIDSLGSKDPKHVRAPLCVSQGASQAAPGSNVRVSRLNITFILQCRHRDGASVDHGFWGGYYYAWSFVYLICTCFICRSF